MIEFCGELSYECKNYIRKKVIAKLRLIVIAVVLFLISILIVVGITWHDFSPISFLLGAIIIFFAILFYNGIARKIHLKIPNKVTVKDGIIGIECEAMVSALQSAGYGQ